MPRIKHALFIALFLVLVFGAAHAQVPTAGIVNSTANVRSGPSTNNDIVGSLSEGAAVEITGCNAECDWYQIGPDRWIAAFLVDATAAPVAQAQTQQPALVAGKMAPLGDQLGDVGQYYSNAGASFGSKTYIQNTTGTAISATINLYNDEGVLIISPAPIRSVPANGRLRAEFSATDGKLRLYEDTTSGFDTTAEQLGTALYGVYHMKITAPTLGLQVVTRNWRPVSNTFAMTDAAGIQGKQAATTLYLPEVTIDRATRWDTEIVVQNAGATDTIIRFELRADNGTFLNESSVPPGLANNQAVLKPNERRIFLASQLAYDPDNGLLSALNGTYGVRLRSTNINGTDTPGAKVVAYTRVFRQGTADAENGALEAFMYTLPPLANEILAPGFIQGGGNTSSARIMNPTNATIVVDYWVYDQNGQLYTNSATLPAYGGLYLRSDTTSGNLNSSLRVKARDSKQVVGVAWTDTVSGHMGDAMMPPALATAMPYLWKNYSSDSLAQSTMRHLNTGVDTRSYTFFPASNANELGAVAANLSSELTAANSAMPGSSTVEYWGVMKGMNGPNHATAVSNGTSATAIGYSASYQPQPSSSATWYVPFVPAPVVAFAWDTSATDNGNDGTMPGPRYGVALFPDKRDQAVSWFKDLNWYFWPFLWDISYRNMVNDQCKSDIRYMVMDKGLAEYPKAPTSGRDPNMVFNSAVRMNAIRNLVPSACTGRPLFLANEPDFVSLQAYMSYPELARQQFVYRAWPGELFSPAFAHASYNDLLDPNTGGFHALGIDRPCELVPPFTPPAAEWGPACANKPYVNLRGLASYYQTGGSFAGLGFNYYAELDGIALHFFSIAPNALAYMRTHRDIAAQDPYNLKIIVTEYGTTSQDDINVYREQLKANLGNYTPGSGANQYDGNPFKLMWYSEEVPMGLTTGATDAITRPIGLGWQNDHGANN